MENGGDDVLRRTPLHGRHLKLGAKMVPFGGWDMPVQYDKGILAEHQHTREKVSIFDISHMGEFRVKGMGVGEKLDALFPRLVSNMKLGSCRYNFLLNENGGVIDDLVVYRLEDDEYYIVVNAATKDGDAEHFKKHLPSDVEFSDESEGTVKLDLQGPGSADAMKKLGVDVSGLRYFRSKSANIASHDCLVSRTGYTGELGYEIYVPADFGAELWDLLLGQDDVMPAGLGARDTLRLEMGYALYGHELDLDTTPIEAGYAAMLNISDDREFIGRSALLSAAPRKNLVPLLLEGRRAARAGAEVLVDGEKAGSVTSGAFSPSLKRAIALAYVDASHQLAPGDRVAVVAGLKSLDAVVAELPFYKSGTARS